MDDGKWNRLVWLATAVGGALWVLLVVVLVKALLGWLS